VANLQVERDGDVLRITLTRPDRHNAFDAELIGELAEAFVDVAAPVPSSSPARDGASRRAPTPTGCARRST